MASPSTSTLRSATLSRLAGPGAREKSWRGACCWDGDDVCCGEATLNEAGAVILFAAPGFYHGAETIDDLVDFVVARCLDQIGIDNALVKRWGDS